MGFYGDGIERPYLDKQGHSPNCEVWKDFDSRFLCSCGAVERPSPRVIPGCSDYEIYVDGNVRKRSTNQFLRVENKQRVARLVDDEGVVVTRRVTSLIDQIFRDLA